MKRTLKVVGGVLALFVVVLVATLVYVGGTQSGLRWVLGMAERSLGGKLEVGAVQGSLWRGFEVQDLRFQDTGIEVRIEVARAQWQPSALLQGALRIRSLYARGIDVHTEPAAEPEAQAGAYPPELSLPVGVYLDDGMIEQLVLQQADQTPVHIERIELAARMRGDRLRVRHLRVAGQDMGGSAEGRVRLGGDYATDLALRWSVQYRGEQWRGEGTVAGDRGRLEIRHSLSGPLSARLQGQVEQVFDATRWQAKLAVPAFDADRLMAALQPDAGGEAGQMPALGRVQLNADAHGDRNRVVVETLQVVMPEAERSLRLQGEIDRLRGEQPEADLVLQWRNLQWPLQPPAQIASAEGSARFNGWLERFQLQLDAGLSVPELPQAPAGLQLQAQLRGEPSLLQVQALQLRQSAGPTQLQANGTVRQWRSETPQFDLQARWRSLQWPLQGEAQVASAEGQASLQGPADDYRFTTRMQLRGGPLRDSRWKIAGHGDLTEARFQTIEGELLDGGLSGNGTLGWDGPLRWQLALQMQQLNPGRLDPAWPGSLSGAIRTAGALEDAGPQLHVTLENLQGMLRERRFQAEAAAQVQGARLQIERLQVRSGDASLSAQGDYGERIDLSWKMDASQLGDLLPEASGSLHTSGRVQGTPQAPRVQATFTGEQPRWRDYQAASVRGSLQGGVAENQTMDVDISITDLSAGGFSAQRVSLQGAGNAGQHRLQLRVEQDESGLRLVAEGGLDEEPIWRGSLRELTLHRPDLGTWELRQPTVLVASAGRAQLERACLERERAALCLAADWQGPQGWSADLQMTTLPLTLLAPFLPPGVQLTGTLDGRADAAAGAAGLSTVNGQLDLSPGALRYQVDEERIIEEKFAGGTLRIQQEQQQLTGRLRIDLAAQDRIVGQVQVAMPATGAAGWVDSALRGDLELKMARLDIVEVFVPQVSGFDGELQGRLRFGGTVGKPTLSGSARLQARQFELPELGTVIKELDLQLADAGGGALQFQGSARSGGGSLRLDGRFDPGGGNPWRAEVQIRGDRFLAARTPEATVYVTPDLRLKAVPKRIDVEGSVTVPEAQLTPKEGRSAVKPSSDVVVVRGDEAETKQSDGWAVYARINLKLGDKVRFTGYGFDGRVSGSMALNDAPEKVTTATGSLNIEDATYTAYGRTLEVDRGRLTFSGNPVTNPGLDLVAARTVDDKRVGVMVSGTAANPRLELFSNPSMSEGDILSYLVLGRPLNTAGEADGDALRAAASSFGLAKGSALAESIGQQLGFEDVSVGSEANSDQPWLTVGRYLSPKLYISYGVGLFEPGTIVRVRYELTEHWKVQGESGGTSSGADILYTIER